MYIFKKALFFLVGGVISCSACLAATPYEKITVIGETASNGFYDPSIEYTNDGSVGYMVYTACDTYPLYLHTHIAKTTDHGQTWTYVQRINEAVPEIVDVYGTTHTGVWHHETATLIHDPDDPGKEWKLYWAHHFFKAPFNPSADKVWSHGWIGYKYTSDPEGAWSAETRLFGAGAFPPAPYTTQIDLNGLDPRLSIYITHIEPGGLYLNNTLYLVFQANNASRSDQILHLIKSIDHGTTWQFVDVLGDSTTAAALGYEFLSAPALVQEDNKTFLLYCGGSDAVGEPTHDGTLITQVVDLDNALLAKVGTTQEPVIYKKLFPTIDTHNSGEAEYDAFNTGGGILFPQLQLTPSIEFQVWNTQEQLLHTPSPTISTTATQTPQFTVTPSGAGDKVLAYPNPGQKEMRFTIPLTQPGVVALHIYNMQGERVGSVVQTLTSSNVMIWDCQDIAPGIYVVRIIKDGEAFETLKVAVVQ